MSMVLFSNVRLFERNGPSLFGNAYCSKCCSVLQDQLPKEELLEALYLEFVNRTNEVGVNINAACQTGQTANSVQFICGLGPRKGAALLKLLKQTNQRLENRTQLVTACHMGPKVFINCAGFIRIDTNSLGNR